MKMHVHVIHNNNPETAENRAAIKDYCLRSGVACSSVSWQAPFNGQSKLFKVIMYSIVQSVRYKKYNQLVLRNKVSAVKYLTGKLREVIYCMYGSALSQKKKWRHSEVVSVIARKHMHAWRQSLEGGADFHIIMEDDAIIKKDFIGLMRSVIKRDEAAFIDFAGGFPEDLIAPNREICEEVNGFYSYRGLVTNTACAYGVNALMLEGMVSVAESYSCYYGEPIDIFLNTLGVALGVNDIKTYRFIEKPVEHGSMSGKFLSWQPF